MPVSLLIKLRQEDQLSTGVQVQPGQHCETPISQKISPVKRKTPLSTKLAESKKA
jgi:hypothetical protein